MNPDRESLAAVAARLIVQSQLTDWSLARRKAAEQLGLCSRATTMSSDDDLIAEIKTYHALYGGDEHAEQIAAQRATAFELMRMLSRFEPRLVGPVAEGWAHEGSDIVIDVCADSVKDVEIELVNRGADLDAREGRNGTTELRIDGADWPIRVLVRPVGRALNARYKTRLSLVALNELIRLTP